MDAQLFVLKAWEQLLRCLRSDFYPYLEDLIPDLLQSARLDLPSCDFDILMEKRRACELLFRLTRQFKGIFFPWIDQVSDILIPLVKDQHVDIHKIALSVDMRNLPRTSKQSTKFSLQIAAAFLSNGRFSRQPIQ
ncbi:hypothetical protein FXO37_06481 [Capsicum annuum]|nr:hypothetical protein FXO37_06481 [Capsicum annuum]